MSKKSSNQGLRLLMGAGSIIGFIGGWAILGQTAGTYTVQAVDKSVVATAPAALPAVTSVSATAQSFSSGSVTAANPTAVATAVPTRTVVQITTQTTTTSSTRTTRIKTGGS